MGIVKFTFVKLIPKYFSFTFFIILFSLYGNCMVKQNKSIQNFSQKDLSPGKESLKYLNVSFSFNNNLFVTVKSFAATQHINSDQEFQNENIEFDKSKISPDKKLKERGKNSIFGIFLTDDEISSLKKSLKDYGNNHIPAKLRSVYNNVVEKSFEYPIILLFVFFVFFFIINILVVFIILNSTIRRKNYKERFEKIYSKMYEEVLLAYMFGSIDWDIVKLKLKRNNKKANRKLLISVLMNFKSNFKGELEHFIPEIYTKLGLQNDSLKLANSYYNHKKVRGIIELIHLYPEGAKDIVKTLINDPNDYVRAEAQTAYIRLHQDTPFNFFYNLERPFTRWTQLSAFNLIRLHQLPVPSFGQFLDFKHFNIKNFSLRMIIFFQQLESTPEVIKMVENEMEQTRFLAYRAINDLRLYDSHEMIKSKYEEETLKNKLEIIKAFKNIGIKEDFEFLEGIMKTETMSFKTEACRSMYYMSSESREKLMQLDKNLIPEIELLISHVTDPRN